MLEIGDKSSVERHQKCPPAVVHSFVAEEDGSVDRHRCLARASSAEDNEMATRREGNDFELFALRYW